MSDAEGTVVYEVNNDLDAGIEAEYRDWLRHHVAEILALPGFIDARVFDVIDPPPALDLKLPPAQLRRAAEDSFEGMMHTLEELADADKRVPRARRDQLYRETNDVFSALSAQLDPPSAADLPLLALFAYLRDHGILPE